MFSTKNIIIYTTFLLACVAFYFYLHSYQKSYKNITTFDECVTAGFPLLETYPEQCMTPDRKTFTNPNQHAESTSTPSTVATSTGKENLIVIDSISSGDVINSPVTITGRARGFWYFEASFPVQLLDGKGTVLAEKPAQAKSNWMVEDFVPFEVTLTWKEATTATGTLIFHKDNPSGLKENDDMLSIPIKFHELKRTINIYHYNSTLDKDKNGTILCSAQGLVMATRTIPFSITPLQDTIKLFLRDTITDREKSTGQTTEYPLIGLILKSVNLTQEGALTLTLDDPYNRTSSGACRASILRAQ